MCSAKEDRAPDGEALGTPPANRKVQNPTVLRRGHIISRPDWEFENPGGMRPGNHPDQSLSETQPERVGENFVLPPTTTYAQTHSQTVGGNLSNNQKESMTTRRTKPKVTPSLNQGVSEDQPSDVENSPTAPGPKPTNRPSESPTLGHIAPETQGPDAGGGEAFYGLIVIMADAVNDLEGARIAAQGRARALRQEKGLPDLADRQEALVAALKKIEYDAIRDLEKSLAPTPLGEWIAKTKGLGFKGIGRLIGAIGDPNIRAVHIDTDDGEDKIELHERTVGQLWAYCGYHVIDGKRPQLRRGTQSNWNTEAKKRAYLLAEACMKQKDSPYRAVYDREREKWAERETTDGHKHNHALSITAKTILKDLWIVAGESKDA